MRWFGWFRKPSPPLCRRMNEELISVGEGAELILRHNYFVCQMPEGHLGACEADWKPE